MEAVLASVIAVLGTVLGSGVTHVFQRRSTDRSEHFARAEKLRQERIDAYCSYAGALLNYRRVLIHRWFVTHENRPDEDTPELREHVYEMRYAAQEAMFRTQMLSDDPALVELAERLMSHVTELHKAEDRARLDDIRERTRQGVRDFIAAATPHVR
ncbi:hypothetical protein [Streptomyces sp. ME19-01-6]|uniref:hypothetical protein n=1 Tax=Streptomyces sp. ME19-01-6 TaxID=3028686 RepID=UPI0029BC9146|nr:hypothetical protein [Streptomyces sp. ME19-01-6]MDX3227422.1 hypothetical protein [Streptomyces sp. ME19-01-6]